MKQGRRYTSLILLLMLALWTPTVTAESIDATLDLQRDYGLIENEGLISEKPGRILVSHYLVPHGFEVAGLEITYERASDLPPLAESQSTLGTEQSDGPVDPIAVVRLTALDRFRGHLLATVEFRPVNYDEESGKRRLTEYVEFSLMLTPSSVQPATIPWYDDWTLQTLSRMVTNKDAVDGMSQRASGQRQSLSPLDSVPCLIITNEAMSGEFQSYADFKTKLGTLTEVRTIESIDTEYLGDSLQIRVRNCIRDYHANNFTEWIIIGADVDVVPGMMIFSLNYRTPPVFTDTYYSNLDHEWNEDGDALFGEPHYYGDSTDYFPDVFVGRIPCNTPTEAGAVIDKLVAYQTDASVIDYQTKVLSLGTNIISPDEPDPKGITPPRDSEELLNELATYLPQSFSNLLMYEANSENVKSQLSSGYGMIVNSSQAQHPGNILTHWGDNPFVRDWIDYTFFGNTMSNIGRYSVFFNLTCFNAKLSVEEATARHFMLNPAGGGIAYFGSSDYSFSTYYPDFHAETFDLIFQQGVTRLGKAVTESKLVLNPEATWDSDTRRMAIFTYLFLGDPHVNIWTAQPQAMAVASPTSLLTGQQSFSVTVSSGGSPVESALVCVYKADDVYELSSTDANGVAAFSNVDFGTEGSASVVATKHNYFPAEELVTISAPCCVLRVGDANGSGGDEPTIGDLSTLIDAKFISGTCDGVVACLAEGDINQSGGADPTCDDISIGDIAILQDYLFITGPTLGLPDCL